ncbi:undecaprenyl-diphosphate phosphatase [Paenibacillus agricola]|uniref:Undecaprenyl-diphosphatase n=1 Tax=Paenibacillus agricola TaxID=2716264 RepID=A0ABX0JBN5_9BACL|nr:undecaprenyl-diphosphate phosphatase [Paenibacillus agricola]NHN33186.1 undecaprenyl-diphosphate phosphatase [Paenibacillus agricola]
MNDIVNAVIMGIVEGLTEFLPVSSTGHMILTAHLLSFEGERAKTFEIIVQLGAVLAVFVLYLKRFLRFFKLKPGFMKQPGINIIHVGLAMGPAVVVGLALHDLIKKYLFGPLPVLISLVAGGILMIVAEKARVRVTAETMEDITYKQAVLIGVFQCLAFWPGFSRNRMPCICLPMFSHLWVLRSVYYWSPLPDGRYWTLLSELFWPGRGERNTACH